MRLLSALLGACLFLCATPQGWATHLGADRQLDRSSPFVRGLYERPLPADLHELYVLASLLHDAHDDEGTAGVARYAERKALLELLDEPAPLPPAKLGLAIQEMASESNAVGALRLRVLHSPVDAEVLLAHVPELTPKIHGFRFRHDGGSVWTRDDGGTQRVIGVKIVNRGTREVLGGEFTLELVPEPKPIRFECRYNERIAAGASRTQLCYGDGTLPVERVLGAIRDVAAGVSKASLQHREVAYDLRGTRFEVRPHEASPRDPQMLFERQARSMIEAQSCGARRACGAAVSEGMRARPVLAGFAIGFIAGWLLLLVAWLAGTRAAASVGVGMLGIVGTFMVAVVVVTIMTVWGGHVLLVALLAGLAAGYAGDAAIGFLAGATSSFAVAYGLGRLRAAIRN